MIGRRALAVSAVVVSLSSSDAARGAVPEPEPHRLAWRAHWPKFRPAEYVFTAGLGVLNVHLFLASDYPSRPVWTGGVLFDDWVRGARLRDAEARDTASLLSDITLFVPQLQPILLDAAVPAVSGEWETAWQIEMINAEAFAITGVLTRGILRIVPRERPVVDECRRDPYHSPRCNAGPYSSFPSGHAGFAFTGAALTCAHHLHLPLFASRTVDASACVFAMTLATASGVFRILDDRHWATDVVAGAAFGLGTGFALPLLLHYRAPQLRAGSARATFVPFSSDQTLGATALGVF